MNFKYIRVVIKRNNLQSTNEYTDKTYEFIDFCDCNIDDEVVVECVNGTQLAKVVQVYTKGDEAKRYVVCKVDKSKMPEQTKYYSEYEYLSNKLDERLNLVQNKLILYGIIAERDSVAKNYYEQLIKLLKEKFNDGIC